MREGGNILRTKNTWGFVILIALAFSSWMFASANDHSPRRDNSTVVIETAHQTELKPHTHADGDAVADIGHHVMLESTIFITPRDLYVSEIGFEIVNAPNVVLHHASLIDLSRPNLTCPNLTNWKELFVYGSDRMYDSSLSFPKGYAVIIPKGSPLKLVLMIHNPEPPLGPGGTYNDVYSRITLRETSEDRAHIIPLEPNMLHLDDVDMTCSNKNPDLSDFYTFTVPPKKVGYVFSGTGETDRAASIHFALSGTLFDLAGHLHGWQGGKELIVKKNREVLHVFKTELSTTTPYIYETRHITEPIHIDAGDTISISAKYDNPHVVATRGVMGISGFYFAQDK